jgi:Acetyltransferase (isoleucine patch superfamily)
MSRSLVSKLVRRWRVFWLWRGGPDAFGRFATRLASIGAGSYRHRTALSALTRKGYISPAAEIIDVPLERGSNVFIGERVTIARWSGSGKAVLGDRVQLHRDCTLEIVDGGSIAIGSRVALQKGCVLFSAVQPIVIRARAQIACHCAFYSYDHGVDADEEICTQPLTSKGPIVVEEDAWLGVGVKVLSGVTIGRGAVIGAGAVVTKDIPPFAIAAGSPARVLKYRSHAAARRNPVSLGVEVS